ncbi:hypothetical protein [Chitinophaga nivalis]|uniref:Uncharacterized protein n=1 Tax=Chitinophaga nivalis TaxID=2991709 RepID=A0ABT3IGG9_9BACT|nr:hypothetical protein [Chitinophaga nivalis]MCW3467250.1 hypothetical protein [Chitinophaga nivalis]MCW3483058.1 hypothetical protein [Chitinophaga nivalis]
MRRKRIYLILLFIICIIPVAIAFKERANNPPEQLYYITFDNRVKIAPNATRVNTYTVLPYPTEFYKGYFTTSVIVRGLPQFTAYVANAQ